MLATAFDSLIEARSRFRVQASGFTDAIAYFEPGHHSSGAPHTIRLVRCASLTVTAVDDESAPQSGVEIRLAFHEMHLVQGTDMLSLGSGRPMGYRTDPITQRRSLIVDGVAEARLTSTTGSDGQCLFEAVPPRVVLHVEAFRDRRMVGRVTGRTVLSPGEQASVSLIVRKLAPLTLRLTHEDGAPLAFEPVGIRRAEGTTPFAYFTSGDLFSREGTTDRDGRVELQNVLAGAYYAGQSPARKDRNQLHVIPPPSLGIRFDARSSGAREPVAITIPRALYVTGVVTDTSGTPLASGSVSATSKDAVGLVVAAVGLNGAFRIGPLVAGECTLTAHDPRHVQASRSTKTTAGTDGIELQLLPPRQLSIRVTSRDGRPCPLARVAVDSGQGLEIVMRFEESSDGVVSFRLTSDKPRAIIVTCNDGRIGTASTDADGFDWRQPIDIEVELAGHIRVRNTTPVPQAVELYDNGGARLATFVLAPDEAESVPVPAGEISVSVRASEGPARRSKAKVVAGHTTDMSVP